MFKKAMPEAEIEKPVDPKKHAALAKGRATQQFAKGKLGGSAKAVIDYKANKVLGKTFHTHKGN